MQHTTWATTAVSVLLLTTMAACGGATTPTESSAPAASPSLSAPTSASPEPSGPSSAPTTGASTAGKTQAPRDEEGVEAIMVTLKDGKVTPNGEKMEVAKGTRLTLQITSDHDDTIHVHGLEAEKDVQAGEPTTLTFTADQVGSFEVESHHPAKVILILNVR